MIVSLLLSYIIWTNPFQYEHPRHDNASNQTQQLTTQSIGDMYLPTTVVKTDQNNKQDLLYSRKTDLMLVMRKKIRHWHFNRVSTVKTGNSDVYLSYLRQRNSLILSYPDEISGNVFNQTFSQSIDSNRVKHINHIVIPLDGSNVYLLSDYHYQIYRFHLSHNSNKKLKTAKKAIQLIPVNYKIVNGQAVMVYPHGLQLPTLGYQVSNQKIDSLSTNLMSSKQHTSVSSNRNGDKVTYTDGTNRHLVYNQRLGTVNYENDVSRSDIVQTGQLYSHFYNVLVKSGMPLNNIRFDEASNHGRTMTYRTYVENFPIINENGYGGAKLQANRSGIERYWLSLYTVQVPLPLNQQTVKLPSTTTVLNQLHSSGRFKDLHSLRVGYLWKSDQTRVVKLVPTYFVKYRGNWVDYTELLK